MSAFPESGRSDALKSTKSKVCFRPTAAGQIFLLSVIFLATVRNLGHHGTELPFEALRHEGRYLIEDYAIAYTPSVSVLKWCMDLERTNKNSLLALGNPNLKNPALNLYHAEDSGKPRLREMPG